MELKKTADQAVINQSYFNCRVPIMGVNGCYHRRNKHERLCVGTLRQTAENTLALMTDCLANL